MTTEKIYGPWIKWDGGECPVPPKTLVKIKLRSGHVTGPVFAAHCEWKRHNHHADIVEFCTITEQPDLEAAEQLLRANDYTVIPPEKTLTFEDLTPMTEAPPKGTWYWVTQPFRRQGVEAFIWGGDEYDLVALRHRMAYLNKEHALIAAKHIFGLKGGEL